MVVNYLLEVCPIHGHTGSQTGVTDKNGEDVNLFRRIDEYKKIQEDESHAYRCGCGQKFVARAGGLA